MNVTCPRCGTVSLAGAQTKRFTCKVCRLRFCNECQHWQIDRKQSYCARCGAMFSIPPSMMSRGAWSVVVYVPIALAVVLAIFTLLRIWQVALVVALPSVVYTSVYLVMFYRCTGLAQATRREAILLIRNALSLAVVIYIVMILGDQAALVVGLIAIVVLVPIGLIAQRANAAVIEELRANRTTWQAILSMSSRDMLQMRFPGTRH